MNDNECANDDCETTGCGAAPQGSPPAGPFCTWCGARVCPNSTQTPPKRMPPQRRRPQHPADPYYDEPYYEDPNDLFDPAPEPPHSPPYPNGPEDIFGPWPPNWPGIWAGTITPGYATPLAAYDFASLSTDMPRRLRDAAQRIFPPDLTAGARNMEHMMHDLLASIGNAVRNNDGTVLTWKFSAGPEGIVWEHAVDPPADEDDAFDEAGAAHQAAEQE